MLIEITKKSSSKNSSLTAKGILELESKDDPQIYGLKEIIETLVPTPPQEEMNQVSSDVKIHLDKPERPASDKQIKLLKRLLTAQSIQTEEFCKKQGIGSLDELNMKDCRAIISNLKGSESMFF